MRHLLNTLFIMTEDVYLALENDNVVVYQDKKVLGRVPLLTLSNIVYFGYKGASPALMGACAAKSIGLCFLTPHGKLLARVSGESRGNVVLRRQQYRLADDELASCHIARDFIAGKLHNSQSILARGLRDHPLSVEKEKFQQAIHDMGAAARQVRKIEDKGELRGVEGNAAHLYFSLLGQLILHDKEHFSLLSRIKRPPKGRVNALLSFAYTLLAHDCASALESVGLDAYVGFLHTDRAGRTSLALDLMEELRSIYADRFVLTLINNRQVKADDFVEREDNCFFLTDKGKKTFLQAWQDRKREEIRHPFLAEKIPWGLVPYVQSLLLARFIRGDISEYPAFLWK
jgi:CRISPR-associated protein Cas1